MTNGAILIAGPTASGKSALALRLAETVGGAVINADSMQVYRELRVLTARPTPADEARAPHALYGVLPTAEACSVGRWLDLARAAIAAARAAGRVPIVVGGTGLYLRALTEGLAPVPAIPPAIRTAARRLHAEIGGPAFHARLAARDPAMAARLRPSDPQRLIRAYEVIAATGESLADWQRRPPAPAVLDRPWLGLLLTPPRPLVYDRCDRRLRTMLADGALDEVRALAGLGLDPALPAMKAVGVPPLLGHVRGEIDRAAALAAAQTATRRYAKRQYTWFRHKMLSWQRYSAKDSESFFEKIFPIISQFLLTTTD